ncbi:hypothetical protein EDB89DRAFT_2081951 [Lactarius sanguifluus]|nr:hypothetical protein EDB89DRAFT_2081951 [Lactarius sanguifluus]
MTGNEMRTTGSQPSRLVRPGGTSSSELSPPPGSVTPSRPTRVSSHPAPSVPMPSILAVLGSLTPAAASTTTLDDDEENWALFAPRVTPVPTPLAAPTAQRVEKRKRDDTADMTETRPAKYPRLTTHPKPPRANPQLGRRSIPLPRTFVYRQRHATSPPVTSALRSLVQHSPPPRQPPSPPNDPDHAPPLVDPDPTPIAPGRTVVEGDNTLTGGVKTLDISDFDSVLAQDTVNSLPQTPPRTYLFPRHALERPHDPDELATRATNRQNRGNTRPYPLTSSHRDPNDVRKARARHALTDEERRRYLTEGRHRKTLTTKPTPATDDNHAGAPPATIVARPTRQRHATAAALLTSPLTVTRDRDRHAPAEPTRDQPKPPTCDGHAACRHTNKPAQVEWQPDSQHPRRADTAETTHATDRQRNRTNAAVELFLRRYDTTQTTPIPTLTHESSVYDAVTRHLDFCLTTRPDMTGITQPFALRPEPRAVLHKWKKK